MTGMEHAAHGDAFDTSAERVHETANRVHVGMEHAIEQAARALWDYDNAEEAREWRDMAWDDMGGAEPAYERAEYELRARALAAAGLLAPAPLRVDQAAAEATGRYGVRTEQAVEFKAFCAGAMWAVKRTEGDGRAE